MATLAVVSALALALPAAAADASSPDDVLTRAGEVVVEPPTLTALGFEWHIEGDANRNARATIRYRKKGEAGWKEGLPLLRLGGEETRYAAFNFVAPHLFAGSLFDLEPDTEYEVALSLTDPDGVSGQADVGVSARTRAEPRPAQGGRVYHVYPPGYAGPKQEPAFTGLLAAYYKGSSHSDWANSYAPRVEPGDVILVHGGLYKDDRHRYGGGLGTVFDGTYYLTADGTEQRPIVIRAAGDGEPIFDGDGNHVLFDVTAGDHHYFEGLTFRNTDVAILAGRKRILGSVGLTVKRSRFEDVGIGITTDWSGSKNFYIADNVFVGRQIPDRLMGWIGRTWQGRPGFPVPLLSNYAVKVYGSGHVIAYNAVSHFHDGIDHATYGDPDGNPAIDRDRMPVSIDIYGNDIRNVDDNCIEADGAMHNIRVLRNRCFNHAHRALSAQPLLGGPAYFIRNVVYHAPEGGSVKMQGNPSGIVFYHNTFVGEVHEMGPASNVHFRNNAILGQGAWPEVFSVETFTNYSSSDYNGFRPNPGAATSFGWLSPPFDKSADYAGERQVRRFRDLSSYAKATGQDRHSVRVDYRDFERLSAPDPNDPTRFYSPEELDFRPRARSALVDAGVVLPNVNDGFTGRAPDLGAYERGQPLPHYGPRVGEAR
jgi:hypothetical protein